MLKLKSKTVKNSLSAAIKQSDFSSDGVKSFYLALQILSKRRFEDSNEEQAKNYINEFFRKLFYKTELNIGDDCGGGIDLAILNKDSDKVSVIVECKSFNASEMISGDNINKKSFHETIRYYLFQRIVEKNFETKYIILTDYNSWYIFDATEYYRLFIKNASFKSQYIKWRKGQLDGKNVNVFYNDVAKEFIETTDDFISCTKFNLSDYNFLDKPFDELNDTELKKAIDLYKFFSPNFLLKELRESDNNQLNDHFYKELLHILGLKQEEKKGKLVIVRRNENETSSLIGNTISTFRDELVSFQNNKFYGSTQSEVEFNLAFELCITWVNRVLFLKLLEAQLFTYNQGDSKFKFLNFEKDWTYNDLDKLFFKVLAKRNNDREESIREKFEMIPYLNSSLFSLTNLESEIGTIKNLDSGKEIPVYSKTKLIDESGKKLSGNLNTLKYFLRFLSAYDFTTDTESFVHDNLINASVLGLIFEKINGYEEGAVFTPSQITVLMCRKTIQNLVIQRFNEFYKWDCKSFDDLKDELFQHIRSKKDQKEKIRHEANDIINDLKICDIAVGSGHFLVSALNELLRIKSKLGILCYRNDLKNVLRYDIDVVNDELIIEDLDGHPFRYLYSNSESQKVQETLFHEKEILIENCLFGVDINSKSVQICQLRLWIELLKNSYYTQQSNYSELETLPNIDINIKTGNSLLYRFDLDSDWNTLENAQDQKNLSIQEYRKEVTSYKQNKGNKDQVKSKIEEFKNNLRSTFSLHDVSNKKLKLIREYINACTIQLGTLFESENDKSLLLKVLKILKDSNAKPKKGQVLITNDDWEKINFSREKLKEGNLLQSLKKLEKVFEDEVKEKENSILFKNAFEWRIEFPEVLTDEGSFRGFDIIIANPPYMNIQTISKTQPRLKELYEEKYKVAKGGYEFANLFIELSTRLWRTDKISENTFILPHKFLNSENGTALRNFLFENRYIYSLLHFGANRVFKEADTFTCIVQFKNTTSENISFYRTPYRADWAVEMLKDENFQEIKYDDIIKLNNWYEGNQWHLLDNEQEYKLIEKLYKNSIHLKKICSDIFQGIATSNDSLYVVDLIEEKESSFIIKVPIDNREIEVEKTFFKLMLKGKDVQRYSRPSATKLVFFPYTPLGVNDTRLADELLVDIVELNKTPLTLNNYILTYEEEFKKRESGKAGKMKKWWGYIYPKSLNKFEQVKLSSMEIATIYPNVILNDNLYYHSTTVYSWVLSESAHLSYNTLLAIANSKLLWWFMKKTGDTLKDDARRFKTEYLNPFPIPKTLDQIKIKKLEEKVYNRQVDSKNETTLDRDIDGCIYDLYNLSLEEIQIVEEGASWGWEKIG